MNLKKISKKRWIVGLIVFSSLLLITGAAMMQMQLITWANFRIPKIDLQKQEPTVEKHEVLLDLNYYLDQPDINFSTYLRPTKVKGIYLSGHTAGSPKSMEKWMKILGETEVNAVVIDVKSDDGWVTFKANVKEASEIGATRKIIPDIDGLMNQLKEHNIFPIARIVVFKDPFLPEKRPDLAIKNVDGSIWRDKKGTAWVNPYNKDVWEYVLDISKEAARVGFKEIQFDYIRFSTDSRMKDADLGPLAQEKSRTEIINEFTEYAVKELKPLGVYISADVFGTIINSKIDADIVGQDYVELAKHLDYICPMVYPSHYSNGSLGIDFPDLKPYETILTSMKASNEKLALIPEGENRAIVRPWLQDFTASWVKPYQSYGAKQLREQIQATYDAGLEEWILWNAVNRYTIDGLLAE